MRGKDNLVRIVVVDDGVCHELGLTNNLWKYATLWSTAVHWGVASAYWQRDRDQIPLPQQQQAAMNATNDSTMFHLSQILITFLSSNTLPCTLQPEEQINLEVLIYLFGPSHSPDSGFCTFSYETIAL